MRNECVRLTFEVHLQPRTLTSYPPTRSPSPRTFFVLQLVVDQASSNQQPPKVIHAFLVLLSLLGTSWIWMWMMPSPSFFFFLRVISNKPVHQQQTWWVVVRCAIWWWCHIFVFSLWWFAWYSTFFVEVECQKNNYVFLETSFSEKK